MERKEITNLRKTTNLLKSDVYTSAQKCSKSKQQYVSGMSVHNNILIALIKSIIKSRGLIILKITFFMKHSREEKIVPKGQ